MHFAYASGMLKRTLCAVAIVGSMCSTASAATVNATACTASAVQVAINSANNGDTVLLPSSCAVTWSATVMIPNTKGITLDGNGAVINGRLQVRTNATVGTRITNFTFTRPGVLGSPTVDIGGSYINARFRLDHVSFTGGGHEVLVLDEAPGLVDHTTWTGMKAANETIHLYGFGADNTTGWTIGHPPGSTAAAIIFEDNVFTTAASQANNAWSQSYYGAMQVWRYNTFNYFYVDAHGGTNVGTRWWEAYKNTFNGGSNAACCSLNMRDGSGIVYGNIQGTGTVPSFGYCEETSGGMYQIGRSIGQARYPAYSFLNGISDDVDNCGGLAVNGMVVANRDIYLSASANCPAGGNCTTGVGSGTTLPTACTTNTAFWKTDAGGNWDTTHGGENDGALYKCVSTNTWALYWVPSTYPDPLQQTSQGTIPAAPASVRVLRSP